MKVKELEKIGRQLLPELPGFAVKKHLLFVQPIGHTLRAICFDGSIDPRGFYTQLFVQPLFIPAPCEVFTFGRRLDKERLWNADAPGLTAELTSVIKREAVPFLAPIQSPRDVAEAVISLGWSGNKFIQQIIAYSFAKAGDVDRAIHELDELLRFMNAVEPSFRDHVRIERAEMLKRKLIENPSVAQRQLRSWEAETAANLGLESYLEQI